MALPQRLGCLGWVVICVAVVVMALGGFALWFMSEGDLRAALDGPGGRPPVPALRPAPPVSVDPAISELVTLLEPWPGSSPALRAASWPERARMAVVPPEFPAVAHRALAAATVAGTGFDVQLGAPGGRDQAVAEMLAVRIARDPPAALAALVADAAAVPTLVEPGSTGQRWMSLELVDPLVWAITARLAELGPTAAVPIAASLRGLRERLWRTRGNTLAATIVQVRELMTSRVLVQRVVESSRSELGEHLHWALEGRWGRAAVLSVCRDAWWAYAGAATPADLVARARALEAATVYGEMALVAEPREQLVHALMVLDVLISALDAVSDGAAPAPVEDANAPGQPLRPILRAAGPGEPPRRIGWYSVGPDGRDDGGDATRDVGFASGAERLGTPRFSDAVVDGGTPGR